MKQNQNRFKFSAKKMAPEENGHLKAESGSGSEIDVELGQTAPDQIDAEFLVSKQSGDDDDVFEVDRRPPALYENYETIDWQRDLARDRRRTRQL